MLALRRSSVLGIVILILIALWIGISDNPLEVPLFIGENNTLKQRPDFVMSSFSSRKYGIDGQPQYRINAAQLTHFEQKQTAELKAPNIIIFNEPNPPWQATSNHGVVQELDTSVHLFGDVRLKKQVPSQDAAPWLIQSEEITIYPEKDIIESKSDIVITGKDLKIEAVGMLANTQNKTIALHHNVKGQHNLR